ncbi:MAG TPA: DUF2723 domain-containing protein, partial [Candidatus Limnocylindrales bacterium]
MTTRSRFLGSEATTSTRLAIDVAAVAAIGVGVVALAACLWRLMPGLGFWDTAEFQMVLPVMGTAHPTGYPTYVLIGWLASVLLQPLGEAALRTNVLSAVLVAIGAAFSVDLARRVSGSLLLGVAAGIGVVLTPIVWAVGTHADPHSLHFAFLAIILWLLVRWEDARHGSPVDQAVEPARDARRADRLLLVAAVVVGLSVGNHSLTLLLGPPIALFVYAVDPDIFRRPRFVAAAIAAFAIPTVLVRFEMVLRAGWFRAPFVYADPSTWSGFWYVTLGQQFHDWFTDPLADWPGRIHGLVDRTVGLFGPLSALIVIGFAVTILRRPRYALLSGTTLVITCFFNTVYPDGAIDRYYIGPVLIAWTWLALLAASVADLVADVVAGGRLGGGRAGAGVGGRREPIRPIAIAVLSLALIAPTLVSFSARATLVDRTSNIEAQRWTDEVLDVVEPNAVVVSWWSYSTPLWYATIVDGRRPDITIIDDRTRLDQNLGELDQVIAR